MILICCPSIDELEELLNKVETKEEKSIGGIKGYTFKTLRGEAFAFQCLIGKVGVSYCLGRIISHLDKVDFIVSLGVAGSLKEDIVPLNVVIASKTAFYDVDLRMGGDYKLGQLPDMDLYFKCDESIINEIMNVNTTLTMKVGTIITGDSFSTKKNMTDELLANFDNPVAVDMESASIGEVANIAKIPYICIRAISDNIHIDAEKQNSVYEEYLHLSARRAASVLMHYLNNDIIEE